MSYTTLLREYATALSLTNDAMYPQVIDQVHGNVAYLWYMANRARPQGGIVFENGGTKLKFAIVQARNSTGKWIYGHDTVNPTPQDEVTSGFEGWSTFTEVASAHMDEILENGGEEGIIPLINTKVQIAVMSAHSDVHQALVRGVVGTTGAAPAARFERADAKTVLPLGFLIQKYDPATGIYTNSDLVHGINQVTDTYWKNQIVISTGGEVFAAFRRNQRRAVHAATFGSTGDSPDLCLCNQEYYELTEAATDVNRRYTGVDADIMFEHVVIGGVTYLMDTVLPYFGSTATDNVTLTPSVTDCAGIYLNTNWIQIVVHEQAYFTMLDWEKPVNQLAIFSTNVTKLSHRVTQRRKHTLHMGADSTVTA